MARFTEDDFDFDDARDDDGEDFFDDELEDELDDEGDDFGFDAPIVGSHEPMYELSLLDRFLLAEAPHYSDDDGELGLLYADSEADAAGIAETSSRAVPRSAWSNQGGGLRDYYDKRVRWGDEQTLSQIAPSSVSPLTKQLLQFGSQHDTPRKVALRLSTTSQNIAAPTALLVATWVLEIGLGSSMQTKNVQQFVGPFDGSTDTDIILELPAQVVRARCFVTTGAFPGPVDVFCAIHLAPVVPTPEDAPSP